MDIASKNLFLLDLYLIGNIDPRIRRILEFRGNKIIEDFRCQKSSIACWAYNNFLELLDTLQELVFHFRERDTTVFLSYFIIFLIYPVIWAFTPF